MCFAQYIIYIYREREDREVFTACTTYDMCRGRFAIKAKNARMTQISPWVL